jgi:hypothetical protein
LAFSAFAENNYINENNDWQPTKENGMIPSIKARIGPFREIQWSYDNGGF